MAKSKTYYDVRSLASELGIKIHWCRKYRVKPNKRVGVRKTSIRWRKRVEVTVIRSRDKLSWCAMIPEGEDFDKLVPKEYPAYNQISFTDALQGFIRKQPQGGGADSGDAASETGVDRSNAIG